jgi:hypothetical protein
MSENEILSLYSVSTRQAYARNLKAYNTFRGEQAHSENTLLSFLTQESKTKAPTTLWTSFSLLKKYLLLECSVDLGTASRISDYLKALSRLHKKTKAPPFTRSDILK